MSFSVNKIEGVKEKMDKKKQLLLSIGLVLILVLMIVGISEAAFKFVGLRQKENTITTGAITMAISAGAVFCHASNSGEKWRQCPHQ